MIILFKLVFFMNIIFFNRKWCVFMKSVGIIRNLDELGRIVIPIEIRKSLNIKERDPIEISVNHHSIILRKKENTCVFCDSTRDLKKFNSKYICTNCNKRLKEEIL